MAKNNAFRLGHGLVSKVLALQTEGPQVDGQNIHLKRPAVVIHLWNASSREVGQTEPYCLLIGLSTLLDAFQVSERPYLKTEVGTL